MTQRGGHGEETQGGEDIKRRDVWDRGNIRKMGE